MPHADSPGLSRRQRQIMDIVYRRGHASAYDILADMSDPPSYSAIRTLIRILEERGHLRHRSEQGRYIYSPTRPRRQAARSALRRVTRTFFNNSAEHAIAALLDESALSADSLDRLQKRIDQARKEEQS
jgi:predicted transcriptional regulator